MIWVGLFKEDYKKHMELQKSKLVQTGAEWIWSNSEPKQDEYAEFIDSFNYEGGKALLEISADSNYAVYINGQFVDCGQYGDFPYDKVYDEIDVTSYCRKGENHLAILVWYYGIDGIMVYYPGNAGLMYVISGERETLCKSGTHTLSRKSEVYMNHRMQLITGQIGLGYGYDATMEDGWISGEYKDSSFTPSVKVDQKLPLRIRPCDRLTLLPEVMGKLCKTISDTDVIYDLGKEQVGLLSFTLTSSCEQDIIISYGEHLVDGCVRRIIGPRDFSISYRAKKGENNFFHPFRRFGCRYLEIQSKEPLQIEKMAIVPTMYVLEEKERPALNEKQNQIYDMCVETLHLCMHEHYEDCPWREQGLYAMDSRNQMLCGYYAFGEYRFPRASLQLISKDNRKDGLLSICYPTNLDLVIPSFSLHYITACREYLEYSKDKDFLAEIYPKLVSIIETFTNRLVNGLILPLAGITYWNFYEWKDGLDGGGPFCEDYDSNTPDLMGNALLSIALQNLGVIADVLGIENTYRQQAMKLNTRIYEVFWDKKTGICYNLPEHGTYSQLGNSFAILCGAISGKEAEELCERMLWDEEMMPLSLSMICFKYDAWLKVNKERFASVILDNIERIYEPMIQFGSTTVWETELGESDFENAGSLCHGWSAMPIYYYHKLIGYQNASK